MGTRVSVEVEKGVVPAPDRGGEEGGAREGGPSPGWGPEFAQLGAESRDVLGLGRAGDSCVTSHHKHQQSREHRHHAASGPGAALGPY